MAERIYPTTKTRQYAGYDLEIYKPAVQIFPRPILVSAGFGANAETMQLLAHELVLQGFVALCPNFRFGYEPRRLGILPDVDRAKVETILQVVKLFGPVDVAAHSKAAIETVLAAKNDPESFRNLVLVAPGGMHPGRGAFAVAYNLVTGDSRDHQHKKQLQQEGGLTADLIRVNREISKAYRKSKIRVLLENLTSVTVSIDQYFPELQRKGIRIAVIAQEQDGFFPPHYLNPQGDQIAGVERFIVLPGYHGAMKFIPESSRRVVDILKELNKINP